MPIGQSSILSCVSLYVMTGGTYKHWMVPEQIPAGHDVLAIVLITNIWLGYNCEQHPPRYTLNNASYNLI